MTAHGAFGIVSRRRSVREVGEVFRMGSRPSMMHAVELPAFDSPLRLVERPIPEPGPGQVRVRVQACGVCGSDLFLQKGGFGNEDVLPVIPGHEAAGVVDALGAGVTDWAVGEQAALYYITAPPGDTFAAGGRANISPQLSRMGVDIDGAFAEYMIRPTSALIRPSEPVDPCVLAVLTDAVATPLHALKRVAHLSPGETLVVLGIGGIGSNAVQLGKAFGARVIAVSRSASKLRLAERLGADEVIQAGDDPVSAVRRLTGGWGADVVAQCVGSARQDEQAIAMGGPGGRVVLIGSSVDAFSVRSVDLIWRELSVLGSRGMLPDDIRDAINLYLDGVIVADHLTERARPLPEANEALDDLREGRVLRSVLVP
jgi:D-arabinose 1-dehydrogenase-like Zn-dependent alcohol dehydrogenase